MIMGCLNVKTKKLTTPITPSITCESERINTTLSNMVEPMKVFTKDIVEHLKAACRVIAKNVEVAISVNVRPFIAIVDASNAVGYRDIRERVL